MTTHKDSKAKLRAVNLFALPCGGFEVRDAWYGRDQEDQMISSRGDLHHNIAIAAFSNLEEALDWLGLNMDRPVNSA